MPTADSEGRGRGEVGPGPKPQETRNQAEVRDGWLLVDGVKVAKVRPSHLGLMIAFHDKCRRRSSARGTDQVEVTLRDLEQALEASEPKPGPADKTSTGS